MRKEINFPQAMCLSHQFLRCLLHKHLDNIGLQVRKSNPRQCKIYMRSLECRVPLKLLELNQPFLANKYSFFKASWRGTMPIPSARKLQPLVVQARIIPRKQQKQLSKLPGKMTGFSANPHPHCLFIKILEWLFFDSGEF